MGTKSLTRAAVVLALFVVAFLLHKLVFLLLMVAGTSAGTGLGFVYVVRRDRKQRERRRLEEQDS
jgi:Flp pilus assembly protein TadB